MTPTTSIAVLRPEPGNTATAARIEATGRVAIRLPLFAVRPLAWSAPDPTAHDALILTSANAVRHAGPGLAVLRELPVYAVGAATAAAARAAGLQVAAVGDSDAGALARQVVGAGVRRALHLAGRDRAASDLPGVTRTLAVYASDPLALAPAQLAGLAGAIALIHSPRAGRRFAELITRRKAIAIVAISPAAAAVVGTGWADLQIAARPDEAALLALALARAD